MQHISFYKDRLPFHPRSNVVIYFDVTGISAKRYYDLIITHYELIEAEFRRGGLEFCFLPKIAHDMDLRKIYRYFNPQASEGEFRTDVSMYDDSDLLNYIVADYNSQSFAPGIIQYMGEEFDQEDTYTFAYTPLTYNFGDSPFELIRQYVKLHGVSRNLFSKNEDHEWEYLEHSALNEEHLVGESFNLEPSGLFPPIQDDINRYYEENDVDMIMSEVQMLVERLRRSGIGEVAIKRLFKPTQQLSRLHIKLGRITLPDYNNMEIKMTPANTSENGNDDDSAGQSRRRFGFDSTGKSATYDISGLKRITIENGREKSEDTIDKIRTGSFVVIKLGDDGKPVSLTLRSFGGRNRGNGGNGKGNGERGNRPEGSRNRNKDRNGRNRRNNDAADA